MSEPTGLHTHIPTLEEIVDYYDHSKLDYQIYNRGLTNLSMHFGLWDKSTHNHKQALMNENRVLADLADVTACDNVLDLGCGYGATAVWLALNRKCSVTGITLSRKQVLEAGILARNRGVAQLTKFFQMDFHKTAFADGTFDVVVAIESICHSSDKPGVLSEIRRILKPEGRLVVADGYFGKSKDSLTAHERIIAKSCFERVRIPPLPEQGEFEHFLTKAGFTEIRWMDNTPAILPTSKRVYQFARMLLPAARLISFLGIGILNKEHLEVSIAQYYAFRDGLGSYGIFLAEKPKAQEQRVDGHGL